MCMKLRNSDKIALLGSLGYIYAFYISVIGAKYATIADLIGVAMFFTFGNIFLCGSIIVKHLESMKKRKR